MYYNTEEQIIATICNNSRCQFILDVEAKNKWQLINFLVGQVKLPIPQEETKLRMHMFKRFFPFLKHLLGLGF